MFPISQKLSDRNLTIHPQALEYSARTKGFT